MKLYAQIINEHEIAMSWDNIKDSFDEEGKKLNYQSPYHTKDDGWYEIPREPDLTVGEYLEYNEKTDTIEIKQREKTPEEIEQEKDREKQNKIQAQYSTEKIIELQDAAIRALARGEELPQEYQDYTIFRERINAKK